MGVVSNRVGWLYQDSVPTSPSASKIERITAAGIIHVNCPRAHEQGSSLLREAQGSVRTSIMYEVMAAPPAYVCLSVTCGRLVFGSFGRHLHWQSLLNKIIARDFSCTFEIRSVVIGCNRYKNTATHHIIWNSLTPISSWFELSWIWAFWTNNVITVREYIWAQVVILAQ